MCFYFSPDPLSVIEARQTQLALHRAEMAELENELDKEAADELLKLRDDVVDGTKTDLNESKTKLFDEMERKGKLFFYFISFVMMVSI